MFACIRVNACVLIRPTSYDVFSEVRSRSKVIKELNIHEFSAMDQWEAAHSGPALNLPDRDFAWFKKSHTIATLLRGQPQNGGCVSRSVRSVRHVHIHIFSISPFPGEKNIIILLFIIASNLYRGHMFRANFQTRPTVWDAVVPETVLQHVRYRKTQPRSKILWQLPLPWQPTKIKCC